MEISFETLILIAIAVLVVVVAVASYLISQSRRRAWEELANRLGMTFSPGNWWGSGMSISGTYRSQRLTLDKFTRRRGNSSITFTRAVVLMMQPTGLELDIYTEGLFSRIGKIMGMKEIQTGDEGIDDRYIIRGQPEEMVLRLLQNYDVRQKLVEAPSLRIKVRGAEIHYEKRGFIKDENTLVALFELMTSLARGIERL